jgi:hypothetical protein
VQQVKSFTEAQLLDFNYQETEDLFQENNLPVDDEWTRAAMAPLSERQDMCTSWLESYFETCGDHSPNSELTKISEPEKKCLYERYQKEMSTLQVGYVNYSRFGELWNVLFPRFISRGYVAVSTFVLFDQSFLYLQEVFV